MKTSLRKRMLLCLLSCIVCFSCAACNSQASPDETATDETAADEKQSAETRDGGSSDAPSYEETEEVIEEITEGELLGKVGAWRGMSEDGTLQERDQFKMITVKSKKDLDPYRQYLSNFNEEYEKTILEDTSGTCVLIELTGTTENTLYGTSSIIQEGNAITILVSTDEVEEVIPKYTFFLLHFPGDIYNGETINVVF